MSADANRVIRVEACCHQGWTHWKTSHRSDDANSNLSLPLSGPTSPDGRSSTNVSAFPKPFPHTRGRSSQRAGFIRPMGLRYKKANITHPTLNVTVQLPILGVKKNPSNPLYTQLGVLTKGTMYVPSIHPSPPAGPFLTTSQHRGQRLRSRYCHSLGQDCLGPLRADHKQPRGKNSWAARIDTGN